MFPHLNYSKNNFIYLSIWFLNCFIYKIS
jgi:hypothetical protein